MAQNRLEYHLCDVFTDTPLAGNQLAVFPDAGHLGAEQMQSLARETNLSETTFLCRREAAVEQERGVRVRIFTTQEELPFAGHPTLGTAAAIRRFLPEYRDAEQVRLELNVGAVPVVFDKSRSKDGTLFGEMTQPEPRFGAWHDRPTLAPVLGLAPQDLSAEWQPQTVSTGMPFCIVPLRSVEALGRLRVHPGTGGAYLAASDAKFFYAIAQEGRGAWRARMQFYNGEDPATGSAAGCAISYLVGHGIVASGEALHLRQGIEIARPSDIFASANRSGEKVSEVRVGGCTVFVASGRFFLEQFT